MEYLCLLREGLYVKWIYAFHKKGYQYECLVSLEKCGDGKRYRFFLWDVVFVICMIYRSMRDMEVEDSKNMGL